MSFASDRYFQIVQSKINHQAFTVTGIEISLMAAGLVVGVAVATIDYLHDLTNLLRFAFLSAVMGILVGGGIWLIVASKNEHDFKLYLLSQTDDPNSWNAICEL